MTLPFIVGRFSGQASSLLIAALGALYWCVLWRSFTVLTCQGKRHYTHFDAICMLERIDARQERRVCSDDIIYEQDVLAGNSCGVF